MGKAVVGVVAVVAAVAIAVAAPYLAPFVVKAGLALGLTISTAVATAIVGATLSIGLSLAFRALGVGAPKASNAVGPPQIFRQSISHSFIAYGKRRLGGLLVFYHPRKAGGDHYRYFVVACAGHRCQGAVSWMLGDEIVTVDGTNKVTSGKYANAAWLWFQRGLASETANATFVSECGGKWTSAHKGNDVAAIYAKFKMMDKVVEAGMPNITAVVEGRDEVYNPGGAAGYTRNAARIFYDWLQIAREDGGFGAYADEIPDTTWISAQTNVCDEVVNGGPRYAIDAVITTGASPSEVRDVLVVNQAGSYTFSGGKHLMRPGYWVVSSATLSGDDLAGPIQVSPFMAADAAANEVQGTYISATDGYQGMPFTTQTTSPTPADVKQLDLDLAFVTNKDQADRIARIMLKRAQAEKTATWPMNIEGLKIKALDTVQLDKPDYGLNNYAWVVTNWALGYEASGPVIVTQLREENADIYADAAAVAPPTVPDIDESEPITPVSEITQLIKTSGTKDLNAVIDASGNVTISGHTRIYDDKSVSVDGTPGTAADGTGGTPIASGGTSGQYVSIYYDDADRAGGAVTYQYLVTAAGADNSAAYASSTNPYRHHVMVKQVPASGTSSGGSSPGSGPGMPGPGGGTVYQ